jgi:hypothetical protein
MHVVLSIGRMELEHQSFAFFNLFNFKHQNFLGDVRVELHKPPLKMKDLNKVIRLVLLA